MTLCDFCVCALCAVCSVRCVTQSQDTGHSPTQPLTSEVGVGGCELSSSAEAPWLSLIGKSFRFVSCRTVMRAYAARSLSLAEPLQESGLVVGGYRVTDRAGTDRERPGYPYRCYVSSLSL